MSVTQNSLVPMGRGLYQSKWVEFEKLPSPVERRVLLRKVVQFVHWVYAAEGALRAAGVGSELPDPEQSAAVDTAVLCSPCWSQTYNCLVAPWRQIR